MNRDIPEARRILALTEKFSRVGFWELDVRNNQVFWSDEVFAIHGRDVGKGVPPLDEAIRYYHPDDVGMVQERIGKAGETGEPFEIRGARINGDDGVERRIFSRGEMEYDADGNPAKIVGIFQDITESERAKQQLAESEERFRLAAAGASVGIWDWVDITQKEQVWSEQFYRQLGYNSDELPANIDSFRSILHPEDQERTFELSERHFRNESDFRIEYRLRHKTKGYRWFLVTAQAAFGPDGRAIRMVGSTQDIHEQKIAQDRLAEANRELDRFAALASHDLQEPLRKMGQFAFILKNELKDRLDEKQERYFGFLTDSSDRLQSLVAGLLEYSRLGEAAVACQSCNIEKMARAVWAELSVSETIPDAVLDISGETEIYADSRLLRQLLQNLISNSLKYHSEDRPLHVAIGTRRSDNTTELRLSDNGIGFDPDQAQRIFEIFARLHRKEVYPGTGLGLALCQRVMELHGGTIHAEGRPGEGSTFVAEFPNPRD